MNLQRHLPDISFLPVMIAKQYSHRLFRDFKYTDAVRKIMLERGLSCTVEYIFTLQQSEKELLNARVQYWNLKNMPDGSIFLCCVDEFGSIIHYEQGYSDVVSIGDVSFTLSRNVLRLRK